MIALQALSEVAAAIYTPNPPPITVMFRPAAKGQPLTEAVQFTIDKSSKLLLQQASIRTDVRPVGKIASEKLYYDIGLRCPYMCMY